MALIAPALLAADFACLGEALKAMKAAGCRMIHIDVGDGHFSPEITVGQPVIESIRKATNLELDVHLLIEEPERYIAEFARAGANRLAVHPESTAHLYRTLETIRRSGAKAGVALEPGTTLPMVAELAGELDFVTILSPAAEEAELIPAAIDKLREACRLRETLGLAFELEVEGGVRFANAKDLVRAGADILVAGSAIFSKDDLGGPLRQLVDLTSSVGETTGRGAVLPVHEGQFESS